MLENQSAEHRMTVAKDTQQHSRISTSCSATTNPRRCCRVYCRPDLESSVMACEKKDQCSRTRQLDDTNVRVPCKYMRLGTLRLLPGIRLKAFRVYKLGGSVTRYG